MKVRRLKSRTQQVFSFTPCGRHSTADEITTGICICNNGDNNCCLGMCKGMLTCCIIFSPCQCNELSFAFMSLHYLVNLFSTRNCKILFHSIA